MVDLITKRLKTGYIKHSFSYEFKITTNTELYQIMFFTPNIRGLEKLKESLWDTFDGKKFYRNGSNVENGQISLFTQQDEKDWRLDSYSAIAKELLLQKFTGETLDYVSIEEFIIENTMLNGNHVIKNILKPLIEEKKVEKMGFANRSSNYKNDKYKIGE